LLDFIEVKNNRYNNVKLQLPLGVRKFNHNIMKKINGVMEKKYLLFAVFVISVIVSLGEFMCTGQIYLMTIITVIQYINQFDIRAFLFLIIYNFALIMPIFVIVIFINKGRSVFQMSEHIRQNMPKIKIINSIILIAIAIFMIIS
jgi:cytochrome c biogenesis protein CcdA